MLALISRREPQRIRKRSLWFWVRKVTKSKRSRLVREGTKILLNIKIPNEGPIFVRATTAKPRKIRRRPDIGPVNICGKYALYETLMC